MNITEEGVIDSVEYEINQHFEGLHRFALLNIGVEIFFESLYLHSDHELYIEIEDQDKVKKTQVLCSPYTTIGLSLIKYGNQNNCLDVSDDYEPLEEHKSKISKYLL